MNENWAGPLDGVKVIDFTRILAGPFATQILADLGAEIIKIEAPGVGDLTRGFPPLRDGESHYFISINHDKKSVVIDLHKPEGVELAKGLVANADVVTENFRPGVMQRWGLDYDTLKQINPRIIYCAVSGFGLSGPLKDKPSFDVVNQALTGAMSVNGELGGESIKMGLPMGDLVGGMFAPAAILSALYERQNTNKGRLIDVSLFDGMMGMLGYLPQLAWFEGKDPKPVGSNHINIVPYGSFRTSDGSIVIACLTEVFWEKLCRCLELSELLNDKRYSTMEGRRQHRDNLDRAIEEKTVKYTSVALQEILDANDVPNAPVLGITDALGQEHTKKREMVVMSEHATLGDIPLIGRPVKFPGTQQQKIKAPPTHGQHTAEVLREYLGLDDAQIRELSDAGVIN